MIVEAKLLVLGAALAVASYQDLRTREIDDRVWLISGISGGALTAAEILTTPGYPLLLAGFSALLTAAIAIGVFYLGLYGGADAKALLVAAVTLPLWPWAGAAQGGWAQGSLFVSPFFPLTLLGNALLLSLLLVPSCLAWNIYAKLRGERLFGGVSTSPLQKLAALLTAVRVKPSTAASVHFNLIERPAATSTPPAHQAEMSAAQGSAPSPEGEGWVLRLFSRISEEDYDKEKEEQSKALKGLKRRVWATPAIPMIVFLLAGYLVSFVLGDLIFGLILLLMGIPTR
ncbi:MAG: A24 family peptidase C-terminal domain-containing protein [Candidatus Methanosuratincola petrocarbonis]